MSSITQTKYFIPGMVLGALLAVGVSASAFGGAIDVSTLTGFTDAQKEAIAKAQEVMENARTEADTILTNAGVDREALHTAMHEARKDRHDAVEAALLANDYGAFKTALGDAPFADTVTEEVFAKLVEAHKLRESGDYAGARDIIESLNLDIPMMGGMKGGEGRGHGQRGMGF